MPRLSDFHYLRNALALNREWAHRSGYAFTMLSPTGQIPIHDFYEPSRSFTDYQLRAHRAATTKRRPSLPHQAGKAFVRIAPFLDVELAPLPMPGRGQASCREDHELGESAYRSGPNGAYPDRYCS